MSGGARAGGGASWWIVGIDLAWGERKRDGVCVARLAAGRARIEGFAYPHGDDALLATIARVVPRDAQALLAIDAPIVCPNATGARPVDRRTHQVFGRFHAGCHPANSTRCRRPPRILERLRAQGFAPGFALASGARLAAEVYPHPALVRMLRLERIVKYKRGRVAARRAEFARLEALLLDLLARDFPWLEPGEEARALLAKPWSKEVEDRADALVCALVGLRHVRHGGSRSEVLLGEDGDAAQGFLLLPA